MYLYYCGISRQMIRRILQHDPTMSRIYYLTPREIHQALSISLEKAEKLYIKLHQRHKMRRILTDERKFHIITIFDQYYPIQLRKIPDSPLVLFAIGNLHLLRRHQTISVIGTRHPSKEASQKIEHIVKPLILNDWVIVSGMAIGIDSMAHQAALTENGMTIAVLGSGLNHIYPKRNRSLYYAIAKQGLVITEYLPETKPKPYQFPERNRIISGLSYATLVIEATEKSGTLITVDQALDQGREVYAVPGSPYLSETLGCHKLIQEGAKLVKHSIDIEMDWEEFGKEWLQP